MFTQDENFENILNEFGIKNGMLAHNEYWYINPMVNNVFVAYKINNKQFNVKAMSLLIVLLKDLGIL